MPAAPEQQARKTIDAMLVAGWRRGRQIPPGQSSSSTEATQLSIASAAAAQGSKALGEPTRIMADLERRMSVAEELEALVTTNLQRAIRLRQAVLQKAFTGELE